MAIGEYAVASIDESVALVVSKAGRFDLGSEVSVSGTVATNTPDVDSSAVVGDDSSVGEASFFWSLSRASSPSTRLSKASSTSVFGPRFFGTASVNAQQQEVS